MATRHMSCYWCGNEFVRDHDGQGWWLCPRCRAEYVAQHTFRCRECGAGYFSSRGAWEHALRVGLCGVNRCATAAEPSGGQRAEAATPLDTEAHCEWCGQELVLPRAGTRFCSGRCRALAYRQRGHAY